MGARSLSGLLACLDLHPVPSGGTGEADSGEDVTEFEGRNQRLECHRVFGGQLLGQFIRIASATCPGKAVKSQHAVFAREGPRSSRRWDEKQILVGRELKLPEMSLLLTPTRGRCQSCETNQRHMSYETLDRREATR